MGKFSRDKGARFEREIANRLKEVFGSRVTRSSGQCFSGDTRADVDCPSKQKKPERAANQLKLL